MVIPANSGVGGSRIPGGSEGFSLLSGESEELSPFPFGLLLELCLANNFLFPVFLELWSLVSGIFSFKSHVNHQNFGAYAVSCLLENVLSNSDCKKFRVVHLFVSLFCVDFFHLYLSQITPWG